MLEIKKGFTFNEVALFIKHNLAQKVTISMNKGLTESVHYFIEPTEEAQAFIKSKIAEKDYQGAGRTLVASSRVAGDKIYPEIKERLAYEAIKAYVEKKGETLPAYVEKPEMPGVLE